MAGISYTKGSKKLKKTFNENVSIKNYTIYRNYVYYIKKSYSKMFENDKEKINQEIIRLNLELECLKNPYMTHIMSLTSVILGFMIKDIVFDGFKDISKNVAVFVSIGYILFIIIFLGGSIIRSEYRRRCYIFSLQALKELISEIED